MIKKIRKEKFLHIMALPAIVYTIVFCYLPLYGIQIAFKNYSFKKGFFGSAWVGLKHFADFFNDPDVYGIIYNTLGISLLKMFVMFPIPIVLAFLLNEIKAVWFKKTVQTVSYFPYFISWTIIAFMAMNWLSPSTGFVNDFLIFLGVLKEPYLFLGEPKAFWWISLALDIWRTAGWSSIIYLAAIAGIDQEQYEAAIIDGANRMQLALSITLPSIVPTISILAILNVGNMVGGGIYASNFNSSYLLGNHLNISRSEIIDTYVLKMGIAKARYSFATAIGLMTSVISMALLYFANKVSGIISGESFF